MSIEFRHVRKTYPDGTTAVEDFSVTIPSHSTTVFVGSSGCGKTTLLRMINRMVDPSDGEILIDGEPVSGIEPVALRRRIGYVMQNSGLLPHRSVVDNVATVPILTGTPKAQARQEALAQLDRVGLDRALANRYPGQLSGGQQQRVGVARGLAADPNILLMDEPFGAVDPIVRDELQQELLRLQRELGKTTVFVTHDIDEAFLLGSQVVILQRGGIIAQIGSPAEILAHPATDFVADFVGAKRGKRRLTAEERGVGDDVLLVDAGGYPAGVISAPEGRLALGGSGSEVAQRLEQDGPGGRRLMDWVWSHLDLIWSLTLTHIGLCVPPIVLGFLISVPLGYWASRSPGARSVLLTLGNIAYTIPGIALVVLVPVVLGLPILNPLNVVLALLLYAVAIMIRSAADAFASVAADVRQSATAQGFAGGQLFWRVELPLAGPVLLAGIRVVSVSTISLATVAALVGIPSLGTFFTDGFQRNFGIETVTGLVAVLVLAAVFDLILGGIGRLLMPWRRGGRLSSSAAKALSQPIPTTGPVP